MTKKGRDERGLTRAGGAAADANAPTRQFFLAGDDEAAARREFLLHRPSVLRGVLEAIGYTFTDAERAG